MYRGARGTSRGSQGVKGVSRGQGGGQGCPIGSIATIDGSLDDLITVRQAIQVILRIQWV